MKSRDITRLAVLATAGVAFGVTAHAATTSYSAGDLFIGFTKTGSSSDYLVDIGQASNFTSQTSWTTVTLSLGNVATDLAATFGSDWATNSAVSWGVVGTTHLSTVGGDGPRTVYASKNGESWTNYVNNTGWKDASTTSLSTADSRITTLAGAYAGKTSTANSSVGIVQTSVSTAGNDAFASYQPGGANATGGASNESFAFFNPSILGSNAGGISADTLGIFRLVPISGSTPPASPVGDFTINSEGSISFTAVPEPASVSLGLAGATLMLARRRRGRK